MKELIFVVVAVIVIGLAAAAEQLGLFVPLKGRKYRALSVLVVLPIALLCGLGVTYVFIALPVWLSFPLALVLVALCVALAIFLVGRILPDKIRSREDEDY
jgi:hypothetical protein